MKFAKVRRYLAPADLTGPPPRAEDRGAGPYPFANSGDVGRRAVPLDTEGIPRNLYPDIGPQYNPITVAQLALGAHDVWLARRDDAGGRDAAEGAGGLAESARGIFERQVAWLVRMARPGPRGGVYWYHDFDNPYYPLRAPWPSAMAQGQVISVLVRAARLRPGRADEMLALARGALAAYRVPASAGGARTGTDEDPWYEEYPTPSPSRVLNGFIFSLWGLADLVDATGDPEAASLLADGLDALARHAADYDLGYWTRYGIGIMGDRPTSPFYHRVHVSQMRVLAACAGTGAYAAARGHRDVFETLARRWARYWAGPFSRGRALVTIAASKRRARHRRSENHT